jgi:hypothetical protein
MPRVGFEPPSPVPERAKTGHALDCATTVIGVPKHLAFAMFPALHTVISTS